MPTAASATYQAATGVLTKVGEADLACVSAQRGYDLAEQAGERVVLASLTHALLAAGRFDDAVQVTLDASSVIEPLDEAARRLRGDDNLAWTAFGPTNEQFIA